MKVFPLIYLHLETIYEGIPFDIFTPRTPFMKVFPLIYLHLEIIYEGIPFDMFTPRNHL